MKNSTASNKIEFHFICFVPFFISTKKYLKALQSGANPYWRDWFPKFEVGFPYISRFFFFPNRTFSCEVIDKGWKCFEKVFPSIFFHLFFSLHGCISLFQPPSSPAIPPEARMLLRNGAERQMHLPNPCIRPGWVHLFLLSLHYSHMLRYLSMQNNRVVKNNSRRF
jgi:hypothetical protein